MIAQVCLRVLTPHWCVPVQDECARDQLRVPAHLNSTSTSSVQDHTSTSGAASLPGGPQLADTVPETDFVLTTRELAGLIKNEHVGLMSLKSIDLWER